MQEKKNRAKRCTIREKSNIFLFSPQAGLLVLSPDTKLALVPLTPPRHGYRQLGHDDVVHMLVPQAPIYPNSRIFVPVFFQLHGGGGGGGRGGGEHDFTVVNIK